MGSRLERIKFWCPAIAYVIVLSVAVWTIHRNMPILLKEDAIMQYRDSPGAPFVEGFDPEVRGDGWLYMPNNPGDEPFYIYKGKE